MKCINCGRELVDNHAFNNSNLNELFNHGRYVFNGIEMVFDSGYVYFVCPYCMQTNMISANAFIDGISTTPAPQSTGGYSAGSGGGPSTHSTSSASSVPASTTQVQKSPNTSQSNNNNNNNNNTTEYYDFDYGDGSNYVGGSSYKKDIDLPTPAVIDYAINKIGKLKDAIGNFLSGAMAGFSTMGLPGLPNVSSAIAKANKSGGGDSNLEKIHTNLKKIEAKLREMDPNYDLYIAIGYLDNLSYDSIIGSKMTESERDEIFGRVSDILKNNKGKYSINSDTESDILAASIKAQLAMGDTKGALSNATKLQTDIIEGVISTILRDYAGVTYFERRQGGGLLIEKASSYTIGIPPNFQGQTMDTVIFYDDGGGYGAVGNDKYQTLTLGYLDSKNYRTSTAQADTIMSKNPNTIVAATKIGKGNGTQDIVSILQKIGVTSNHTIISGFSAGGNAAVQGAQYVLQNSPNLKNVELFLLDSNNLDQIGNATFQYLAQNGVKATVLNGTNEKYVKRRYHYLYDNGIDTDVINLFRPDTERYLTYHTDHKAMAFNDNLYGYLLGNIAAPATTSLPASFQNAPYKYSHLNAQTGTLEDYVRTATSYTATPVSFQSTNTNNSGNTTSLDWNYGTKVSQEQLELAFPNAKSIKHNANGIYEVNFQGDILYVPENASLENMNIVALWPGENGHEHDSWVGNAVNSSSNICVFNGHNITSATRLTNIINNNNVHVSNAQLSVFSASGNSDGGFKGINQLGNIINNTKGNVDKYQVVSYDGSFFGQSISDSTLNTLLDTGTQVYLVASSSGGHPISVPRNAKAVSATGIPTYYIQTGSSDHMHVTPLAFANNIPGAIMGQGDIYSISGYTSQKI